MFFNFSSRALRKGAELTRLILFLTVVAWDGVVLSFANMRQGLKHLDSKLTKLALGKVGLNEKKSVVDEGQIKVVGNGED